MHLVSPSCISLQFFKRTCYVIMMSIHVLHAFEDVMFVLSPLGVVSNNITGIDAMSPSSKDDFTEFERLLKEKITLYEKSIHYSSFLESLFRDLCLSCEFGFHTTSPFHCFVIKSILVRCVWVHLVSGVLARFSCDL